MKYAALLALMLSMNASVPTLNATDPKTLFVEVEPGVKLEVLDWGGTGRPVIIVPGSGRTAHDFDTFGPALSAGFHAYSITRRGTGASSRPPSGYSADRLADDVLAIVDTLHLVLPIVAGHSLGGQELSSIGSRHPEKVAGLVYLDAAYGYAFYDETDKESRSLIDRNESARGLRELTEAAGTGNAEEAHRLIAQLLTTDLPALEQTLREMQGRIPTVSTNPPQGFIMRGNPGPDRLIIEGMQRHAPVRAPVLAIYALKGVTDSAVITAWKTGTRHEIIALRRGAKQARVVIFPEASHNVFRSNERDVLREMQSFAAGLK